MGVKWNQRFLAPHGVIFPNGAAINGVPVLMMKYNDRKKAYTNEPERDEETGLLKWKAKVWDFSEDVRGTDAGLELIFLAPVQPIPTGKEIRPGLVEVEFENLMVQPRVTKSGDYAKLTYLYFATGIKGDASGTVAPGDHSAAAPRDRKAVA
ncbi:MULTISPECIES: hypothetical protein [unclassified Nocardia]|uniref:hypothetical protein n=1 Tax=unclassified Nocardia TaxID=2637762 RepID=UPI001CE45A80|nr:MULTISPECIES: hypothetical protein [unclassified Nocardia]